MSKKPPERPPLPRLPFISAPEQPASLQEHLQHLQQLLPKRVRWFYAEEKRWIPFGGADSMEIENVYRTLPGSLQRQSPEDVDMVTVDEVEGATPTKPLPVKQPIVRGSLYEVDIPNRECKPLYWQEAPVPIMRGTWFQGNKQGHWEPMEERHSIKIEEAHQEVVRSLGSGVESSSIWAASDSVIHQIKVGIYRVEWHDINEVFVISESTGSKLAQKIGLGGAVELHRGYDKEATSEDKQLDINHIVFLVHGMGQLYHGEGGIVNSRKKFSDVVQKAKKKFFKDQDTHGRIEFFPLEWRTSLKLDEGIINTITPSNLGSLRKVLNETTLDVMYYTSPFYRDEIIQAVREQLNRMYCRYCERNPLFRENGGKVSIIAHSLGSVIIHDMLTLWNSYLLDKNAKQADQLIADGRSYSWFWGWGKSKSKAKMTSSESSLNLGSSSNEKEELKKQIHEARLKLAKLESKLLGGNEGTGEDKKTEDCYSLIFEVENVFNIGSPLGVFLVMRGIRPRSDVEQHILPTSVCKHTYNIYDPTDPIAYRLEPLIYEYYTDVPPVRLSRINTLSEAKRTQHAASAASAAAAASGWLKSWLYSRGENHEGNAVEFQHEGSHVELPRTYNENVEEVLSGKRVLEHRIDYVLEASMVEYFSAITSHQSYWHNLDFAKFVVSVLYFGQNTEQQIQYDPQPAHPVDGL